MILLQYVSTLGLIFISGMLPPIVHLGYRSTIRTLLIRSTRQTMTTTTTMQPPTTRLSPPSLLRKKQTQLSETINQQQIIVDTDVGLDDLFALTLLLGSPIGHQLKLITTVHGMTHPTHGASIVRSLIARFGREDITVIAGAATPEDTNDDDDGGGHAHTLADVSWGRGVPSDHAAVIERLGLPTTPTPTDSMMTTDEQQPAGNNDDGASKTKAANALAHALRTPSSPPEPPIHTTLICLGPHTNLAAAIPKLLQLRNDDDGDDVLLEPSSPTTTDESPPPLTTTTHHYHHHRRPDLILMGGAIDVQGNSGPNNNAEFNLYANPHAAHTVFKAANQVFQSVRMGDLATANGRPCDRVTAFFRQHVVVGEEDGGDDGDGGGRRRPVVAAEVLRTLASDYPASAGYDPVVTMFLLDSAAIATAKVDVVVDAVTGVSSRVVVVEGEEDENLGVGGGGGARVSLGTGLDIDAYLSSIEAIVRGDH